ncbi:hypothetical protein [Dyadobacter diqingensis]|uniref:hypothetical protein n=1 Tax=Dyadobacter diqingensis TaxID=2938121 RepID=UPI0020C2CB6F|nr:hypothetical protein [Dyadobacter diqingensis]
MKIEEAFKLNHIVVDGKDHLTISPDKHSEGYHPTTMEISPEQFDLLKRQINSGVAFKIMQQVNEGKIELTFSADKIDIKVDYNYQTIEISQEQWDELRYTFMTGINDAKGLTKLCYLQ